MMGTRSLTVFVDGDDEEIVVMYRHLDGYIEWYGKRLCAYLELFESENSANGMACLSAQTIMHFKSNVENPNSSMLSKGVRRIVFTFQHTKRGTKNTHGIVKSYLLFPTNSFTEVVRARSGLLMRFGMKAKSTTERRWNND